MKLETAEKTLITIINEPLAPLEQEDKTAILLSIQALRECKKARKGNPALDGELLPGETLD